jgi:hypothetical protein
MRSRHISTVIPAAAADVYDFAADPRNLPRWAAGLAQSEVGMRSPMGEVTVRFVPRNDHGVLDHDVTLPSGTVVTNPLRVLAHPDGSEVVFTVRQIELSDDEFDRDCAMVAEDLARLREIFRTEEGSAMVVR